MVGGTAYMGYKAGQNRQAASQQEADQEARIQQLEQQQQYAAPPPQQYAPPPPPAPPPAPAAGGTDLVGELQKLAELRDAGALTPDEFNAAKSKLLAG
jgi:hypothetical protein